MSEYDENIFTLMEQAEMLQKAAKSQQENVKEAVGDLRRTARFMEGPLVESAAERIAAAVSNDTQEQIRQLRDTLGKEKTYIEDKLFWGWAFLGVGFLLALSIIYFASGWSLRGVKGEWTELHQEMEAMSKEIAIREKTIQELETLGITLGKNDDGEQWIRLPKGMSFGDEGTFKDGSVGIAIERK